MSQGPDFPAVWRDLGALVLCRHDRSRHGMDFSALMPPAALPQAAKRLYEDGYMLDDVAGAQVKEGFLVTYHFDHPEKPGRLALRALADANRAIPSIASVFQGAEWHEREAYDFFGVIFSGNPNLAPILLSPDYEGAPPLLKAEADLASMADLKLFGEAPEVLDPAWRAAVSGLAAESAEDSPAEPAEASLKEGGEAE